MAIDFGMGDFYQEGIIYDSTEKNNFITSKDLYESFHNFSGWLIGSPNTPSCKSFIIKINRTFPQMAKNFCKKRFGKKLKQGYKFLRFTPTGEAHLRAFLFEKQNGLNFYRPS
ncbi:hypothetical protein HDR58_05585 [bacterium]|nr:hypothetical protein [bacterium]